MQRRLILFQLLIFTISIVACKTTRKVEVIEETIEISTPLELRSYNKPKNVIVMIGDGMGVVQIASGMYSQNELLNLEKRKDLVVGLHKNTSFDDLVTDSAAGATAFSCGQKTYNGAIGVDHDTLPLKTILEIAQENQLKTGLVATSTIVHATPASFAAHNRKRSNYEEIALDMSDSGVDVMIGGGAQFFNNREDEINLYNNFKNSGYHVSDYFMEDFSPSLFTGHQKLLYLTAVESPLMASQGRNYLESASSNTIQHLDSISTKGFFAMIEGSQIDWGGHANDANYITSEMLDFDRTIGAIAEWVEKDKETLLIITADHETGGFAIEKGSVRADSLVTSFTSDYHTASLIPVFAIGPGSEEFSGIYENTEIFHKIKKIMAW